MELGRVDLEGIVTGEGEIWVRTFEIILELEEDLV